MWFCSPAAFYRHTCHWVTGWYGGTTVFRMCLYLYVSPASCIFSCGLKERSVRSACHSSSIIDSHRYLGNIILSVLTCFTQLFQRFQMRMNKAFVKSVKHLRYLSLQSKRSWTILYIKFQSFTDKNLLLLRRSSRFSSQLLSSAYLEKECLACFPPKREENKTEIIHP